MKLKNATLWILLVFQVSFAQAQGSKRSYSIKELPASFTKTESRIPQVNLDEFYDLTKSLPDDYSENGDVDYTDIIQSALLEHKNVIFPDFPVLINDNGLSLVSDSKVFFPERSKLILKPNSKERYEVLRLDNVSDVILYNPEIKGDRDAHLGSSGEWGMGIAIRASNNITIYNPKIEKCWGDGIYFGHLKNVQVDNVKIYNAVLNNNRRNGISITSGNNVLIESPVIFNTVGVAPQSGIVIEPSNVSAEFNGISLVNPYTFNNYSSGIQIGGLEKLIGKTKTPINIEISNPTDNGSNDGMFIGRILSPDKLPGKPLSGVIKIINPTWINNVNSPFTKRKLYERGPKIEFRDLSSSTERLMWREFKYDKDVKFVN